MAISELFQTGMSSGIPWAQVRDAIIEAESAPLRKVERDISSLRNSQNIWSQLEGMANALRTSANPFRTDFAQTPLSASITSSASGTELFHASAHDAAAIGTYQVEVLELARAETRVSQGFASSEDPLGLAGDLDFGGTVVEVLAGDSLMDIRNRINDSDAGVRASIIQVGAGDVRLSLRSEVTGAAGIDLDAGALAGDFDFTVQTAGSDARISVDGVEVVRSQNQIDDVLDGIILDLQAAEVGSPVELTVAHDLDALADNVQKMVQAYNHLTGVVRSQTVSSSDGTTPPLYGSRAVLRMGLQNLRDAMGGALFEIGVSIERNGSMSFDRDDFKAAFEDDPAYIENKLSEIGDRLHLSASSWTEGTDSIIRTSRDSQDRQLRSLEQRRDRYEARLERREENLTRQFNAVERIIAQWEGQADAFMAAFFMP